MDVDLLLFPPDLVVAPPGLHGGRAVLFVLEGRVEDEEIVVHVRVPPVAEPSVLVAKYLLFNQAAREQRPPVLFVWSAEKLVIRKPAPFVIAAGETINLVE